MPRIVQVQSFYGHGIYDPLIRRHLLEPDVMKRYLLTCLMLLCITPCMANDLAALSPSKIKSYETGAESGDSASQEALGVAYLFGRVNKAPDVENATYWLLKSAHQNNRNAAYLLGLISLEGLAGQVNYKDAAFWFKQAASRGHAEAQLQYGKMLLDGHATAVVGDESPDDWIKKAAVGGSRDAQVMYAKTILSKSSGAVDYQEVTYWLEKAAQQGHSGAQQSVGIAYQTGTLGVPKDYEKAAYWLKKAVTQGQMSSAFNLGRLYQQGQGVVKNLVYAHFLLNVAAGSGHKMAANYRDELEQQLTSQQVRSAQRLASSWRAGTKLPVPR